jgi:hypothetical protein
VLVEVKVSRADFLRDAKKTHRHTGCGMGQERWYLAPPGILRAADLPEGWGLAEAHAGVVRVVKPARAKDDTAFDPLRFRWEIGLLVSLVQGERIARKVDHIMGDVVAPPELPEEPEYAI